LPLHFEKKAFHKTAENNPCMLFLLCRQNWIQHQTCDVMYSYVCSNPSGWKHGSQPKFLGPLGSTILPWNNKNIVYFHMICNINKRGIWKQFLLHQSIRAVCPISKHFVAIRQSQSIQHWLPKKNASQYIGFWKDL